MTSPSLTLNVKTLRCKDVWSGAKWPKGPKGDCPLNFQQNGLVRTLSSAFGEILKSLLQPLFNLSPFFPWGEGRSLFNRASSLSKMKTVRPWLHCFGCTVRGQWIKYNSKTCSAMVSSHSIQQPTASSKWGRTVLSSCWLHRLFQLLNKHLKKQIKCLPDLIQW